MNTFRAALAAVAPQRVVPATLPKPPRGRTIVVGAGKASAAMAAAVEQQWPHTLQGAVVVPHGYGVTCRRIEVIEAAHPLPDDFGLVAARTMKSLVTGLDMDDLVIALFSGGGSALLPLPAGEVSMEDKRSVITQLLHAGASIAEINCLRKHLSAIKGGRLACAAAPARVANMLISDVAGDDPAVIASGPMVADPSTLMDALGVIEKYGLRVSPNVRAHLGRPENESPKPGDDCFERVSTSVVASATLMLDAAAVHLAGNGIPVHVLGDAVEGESRDVAAHHADVARAIVQGRGPLAAPCALLSGGETTVAIRGNGRGGSNLEFLLALTVALRDDICFSALACDTDGSDGSSGVAGAVTDWTSLSRATRLGLDAESMLAENDSLSFFEALDDLVITGPTFNNVNDLRIVMVHGAEPCRGDEKVAD